MTVQALTERVRSDAVLHFHSSLDMDQSVIAAFDLTLSPLEGRVLSECDPPLTVGRFQLFNVGRSLPSFLDRLPF
jgi:hypothetical protein